MAVNERLDSWKEISLYIKKSTRTCHKWRKELGLPVYRIYKRSKRSPVFAFKSEIDDWFKRIGRKPGKKTIRVQKAKEEHKIKRRIVHCLTELRPLGVPATMEYKGDGQKLKAEKGNKTK